MSFLLGLSQFQNRINAFLFGILYETTGVHNRYLTLRMLCIMGHMITMCLKESHQCL